MKNQIGCLTAGVAVVLLTSQGYSQGPAEVLISTEKACYRLEEAVAVRIQNHSSMTIWIPTACGAPFTLLKRHGSEWEAYGAYPTKDCLTRPLKIEPTQEPRYTLEVGKVYGEKIVPIEPGRYKFQIAYTTVDPKVWPVAKIKWMESSSNEFTLANTCVAD